MKFLILPLIVLVATLNIISGLIMLVKDKGSDIAILRTMGLGDAGLPGHRRRDRCGRHIGRICRRYGGRLNIESLRQFLSRLTSTDLFPPELY